MLKHTPGYGFDGLKQVLNQCFGQELAQSPLYSPQICPTSSITHTFPHPLLVSTHSCSHLSAPSHKGLAQQDCPHQPPGQAEWSTTEPKILLHRLQLTWCAQPLKFTKTKHFKGLKNICSTFELGDTHMENPMEPQSRFALLPFQWLLKCPHGVSIFRDTASTFRGTFYSLSY